MDIGLNSQQRLILRRARVRQFQGSGSWQIRPPLWLIALLTLLPLLLLGHPARFLSLPLIPCLGIWQRRRVAQRIGEWALELREL